MSWMLLPAAQRARGMTQSAKLVLFKLVDHADDDGGHIFPSVASLAEMAMCDRRTVQRILRDFCAVGLLSIVERGGGGPKQTTRYRLHIDVLDALASASEWARRMAGVTERNGEEYDDIPISEGPDSKGGVMPPMTPVSPLGPVRAALATDKGDTGAAQTLIEPLKVEREGARARHADVGAPADDGRSEERGISSHGGHAGSGAAEAGAAGLGGREPVTLAALVQLWPSAPYDDMTEAEGAWAGLDYQSRCAALDLVAAYLAGAKRMGRTKVCALGTYLTGRRWERLSPPPATEATQAPVSVWQVEPWTRDWWALLLKRARDGRAGFMLTLAEARKPVCCPLAEKPGEAEISGLKPYPASGPEVEAWRRWFLARRATLPKFRGDMWVWLPDAAPEGV